MSDETDQPERKRLEAIVAEAKAKYEAKKKEVEALEEAIKAQES